MSDFATIRYDVSEGICTVTLSRPDQLNAFNIPMMRELIEAFDRIDADDDVRVVIVTGSGRAFCAGADLASGSGSFDYDGPVSNDETAEFEAAVGGRAKGQPLRDAEGS